MSFYAMRSPLFAQALIKEIGYRKIQEICKINASAVCHWKNRGIPFYRLQYLKTKLPELEAWCKLDDYEVQLLND